LKTTWQLIEIEERIMNTYTYTHTLVLYYKWQYR